MLPLLLPLLLILANDKRVLGRYRNGLFTNALSGVVFVFLTGVTLNQANGQIFFSPNNQPFPLGVNMQVTPVVSADRRFVRLNLTPTLTNLASTNVPLIPVQIPVPQLLEGPRHPHQVECVQLVQGGGVQHGCPPSHW